MVQVSGENLSAKLSWLGEWRYCEPYDVIVVNAAASRRPVQRSCSCRTG